MPYRDLTTQKTVKSFRRDPLSWAEFYSGLRRSKDYGKKLQKLQCALVMFRRVVDLLAFEHETFIGNLEFEEGATGSMLLFRSGFKFFSSLIKRLIVVQRSDRRLSELVERFRGRYFGLNWKFLISSRNNL